VNSHAVLECDNAQIVLCLGHPDPVSHTAVQLSRPGQGIFDRSATPFPLDIGPLSQDLFFELASGAHRTIPNEGLVLWTDSVGSVWRRSLALSYPPGMQ
jgi:hypothetical protein